MANEVSGEARRIVAHRAYHVCEYCLLAEDDNYLGCEVDHIISIKHGGATVLQNLAYACFMCNRKKGTDVGSIALKSGEFSRFFNPRTDPWAGHFYLRGARIEHLTDVGEVTARILDFNGHDRLERRELLVRIGRFPTIEALARMKE
jgi:hypothetical protein